jgi:hypothetical protein
MTERIFEIAASSGALFIVAVFCTATIAGLLVPTDEKRERHRIH